jgi:RNA-directed DNA polymerase
MPGAVEVARAIVTGGKAYVVDIDLANFFDRIHPDRLVPRLSQQVNDKRILRLIGLIWRRGLMADGVVSSSTEGAVPGRPLSPLLNNIVLDELGKELERRGLEFCRFADDCNRFVKTSKVRVPKIIDGLPLISDQII